MKRYKLLKDLPTFKGGEEFGCEWRGAIFRLSDGLVAYSASTHRKFPNILTDWFEEIPEQPKTVWDLEAGDIYWLIRNSETSQEIWYGQIFQRKLRDYGNVFLTREEAEKEIARRKAKQILLRDTKGFKPKAKEDYYHCKVEYSNVRGLFWSGEYDLDGDLYFQNKEDAKASIKAHEKEWKIYLGVEEND